MGGVAAAGGGFGAAAPGTEGRDAPALHVAAGGGFTFTVPAAGGGFAAALGGLPPFDSDEEDEYVTSDKDYSSASAFGVEWSADYSSASAFGNRFDFAP